MFPRVAVLLAAFNGVGVIEAQINSLLAQINVRLSIYISVDFSSDETYEFVLQLAIIEPRIYVLQYGEQYGGPAKNFFRLIRDVDFSNYDYIAFSDQDDIWLPNKLKVAIDQMVAHSIDAYSSDIIAYWEFRKIKIIKKSYAQKKLDFLFEAGGPGCTYVFKQSSLTCFKIFLEKNWHSVSVIKLHDWLIYAFYRTSGFKWLIDNRPLILYRQHLTNQFGINGGFKAYWRRVSLVKTKWYSNEVNKIAKLLGYTTPTKIFIMTNFLNLRRRSRDSFLLLFFVLIGLY